MSQSPSTIEPPKKQNFKNSKAKITKDNYVEEKSKRYAEASPRVIWNSNVDYLTSIANLSIGIGNLMSFPGKFYHYRGGAFLIAYFTCLFFVGAPVLYLELLIGQYNRCSPVVFFRRCAPALHGLGWLYLICTYIDLYTYQYTVSSNIKFLFSLTEVGVKDLIWTKCGNKWNDNFCFEFHSEKCVNNTNQQFSYYQGKCVTTTDIESPNVKSADVQYDEKIIDLKSPSFLHVDEFNYGLMLCIMISWISASILHNRGVAAVGKFSIIPMVLIFLICPFILYNSLFLSGALDGIAEMFTIDWLQLLRTELWLDALHMVIFSLSLGLGGHIVLASFSPPQANTFRIMMMNIIMDTSISLIVTGAVYAALGHLKTVEQLDSIYKVAVNVPPSRLAPIIIPVLMKQVVQNYGLWVFLYHLAVAIAGWGTTVVSVQTVSVIIADAWTISTKNYTYDIITLTVNASLVLTGTFLCFDIGPNWMPVLTDIRNFVNGLTICGELLVIIEVYGIDSLYLDMHVMMGRSLTVMWNQVGCTSPVWKPLWRICPAFSMMFILSLWFMKDGSSYDYRYPHAYDVIRLVFGMFIVVFLLFMMRYARMKYKRHFKLYEKKKFTENVIWMKQRHLRCWLRVIKDLKNDEEKYAEMTKVLPILDPDDLKNEWRLVYRQFFQPARDESMLRKKRRQIKRTVDQEAAVVINNWKAPLREVEKKKEMSKSKEKIEERRSAETVKHDGPVRTSDKRNTKMIKSVEQVQNEKEKLQKSIEKLQKSGEKATPNDKIGSKEKMGSKEKAGSNERIKRKEGKSREVVKSLKPSKTPKTAQSKTNRDVKLKTLGDKQKKLGSLSLKKTMSETSKPTDKKPFSEKNTQRDSVKSTKKSTKK